MEKIYNVLLVRIIAGSLYRNFAFFEGNLRLVRNVVSEDVRAH